MTTTNTVHAPTNKAMLRTMMPISALVRSDVQRSLSTWRWFIIPVVYVLIGAYYAGNIQFDYVAQQPRNLNIWDIPPAIMSDGSLVVWLVALGFILLVGDGYLRERDRNTLALTLARVSSRTTWWIAKLTSLGMLALCYVGLMFTAILCGSLLSVPFSLTDSPQSRLPVNWDYLIYPRLASVPMPLFVLLIALYTAFALWIVGSIILLVSLFVPKLFIPFATGMSWAAISVSIEPWLSGKSFLITLPFFVSYIKHFSPYDYVSLSFFWVAALSTLLIVFLLGAWRLRRIDI